MRIRKTIFGRIKAQPNTFIGGVSASITSAAALAAKIGISPTRIKGFKVVGSDIECNIEGNYNLPANVFYNDNNITSYIDNDGLVSLIPIFNAFRNAVNLTSVKFPNITHFGNTINNNNPCFAGCINLVEVDCPNILQVDFATFNGCSSIVELNFPLCTIFKYLAFNNCTSLERVNAPNVQTISRYSFNNCHSLIEAYYPLSNGVLGIGAFTNCYNLPTATFGEITEISVNSFNGCSVINNLSFPYATIIRGGGAFRSCSALTNINLPELTSIIGNINTNTGTFTGTALQTISLPKLTSVLDGFVFYGAANLETIYMPLLTSLGSTTGNNLVFLNIKLGATITVPVALQTVDGGNPDGDLVYASGTRGATIIYI